MPVVVCKEIITHDHFIQHVGSVIDADSCTAIHIMLVVIEMVRLALQLPYCKSRHVLLGIREKIFAAAHHAV